MSTTSRKQSFTMATPDPQKRPITPDTSLLAEKLDEMIYLLKLLVKGK